MEELGLIFPNLPCRYSLWEEASVPEEYLQVFSWQTLLDIGVIIPM